MCLYVLPYIAISFNYFINSKVFLINSVGLPPDIGAKQGVGTPDG
jgi:hypothetical protein